MDITQLLLLAFLTGAAWLYVLMVIVGLGLIIFVHELGHFLVAKACGVKCEKFYLGFDVFGLRLWRFQWGETEYGIGILPLGGYVKMLGQEDNPARLREELERAKKAGASPNTVIGEDGATMETVQAALYDSRSYLAKSVPQRMAIISAGVIMNLIFALVVAIIAFYVGIDEFPCAVGQVAPGEGAWRAGIKPGDQIAAINGRRTFRFQDIQQTVPLTRRGDEVRMVVERTEHPDEKRAEVRTLELKIVPDRIRVIPTIGVSNALTTELADPAYYPSGPAAERKDAFLPGRRVVKVGERWTEDYAQLHRAFAETWGLPVEITLELPGKNRDPQAGDRPPERVTVQLPPTAVRDIGIIPEWGRIVAIQADSPAAEAGLRPGDTLVSVECPDLEGWSGNLLQLPYLLQTTLRNRQEPLPVIVRAKRQAEKNGLNSGNRGAAGQGNGQGGEGEEVTVTIPARLADSYADLFTPDSPWEIPQLGIAVEILPRVRAVVPGSPAAEAGIQPGDILIAARTVTPKGPGDEARSAYLGNELDVRFDSTRSDVKATWAMFFREFQKWPAGTEIDLEIERAAAGAANGKANPGGRLSLRLQPVVRDDWFLPDRHLIFQPQTFALRAKNLQEAIKMGSVETWSAVTLIYRILNRLGRGDVSPRALVGPIGLVQTAYRVASQGAGRFLLFLTLLSANLAVVNFLPIPVLDGGHMVFLIYEGIRGKPPSEAVYVGLSYLGLAIILGIMLWVFGLDLGLISR